MFPVYDLYIIRAKKDENSKWEYVGGNNPLAQVMEMTIVSYDYCLRHYEKVEILDLKKQPIYWN